MSDQESSGSAQPQRKGLPLWGKALAAVSVVLMLAGVGVRFVGGETERTPAPARTSGTGDTPGVTGLAAGGMEDVGDSGPSAQPEPESGIGAWGPSVFRIGFSAFVGFAVAYALRSFLKFALIALGFFFLALFGLQYAGLIEVKWAAMGERYDELSETLGSSARSAWDSMAVLLPSAASATAGLIAGFWRSGGGT